MASTAALPPELLTRGVQDIVVRKSLEAKLTSGEKLRIKHGVDPTNTHLHIGYAVTYWKLRQFQELGHTIIFLIGDFTGRFGDPTEKLTTRTLRDKSEVEAAAAGYLDQLKGILDLKKTEVRRNSEWYDKMSAEDLLRLMSQVTVSQMLERDMFALRQKSGVEIGLHEPVYPLLQGYDSVMLESDLTVVGSDQLFNELQARPLQTRAGQQPQDVMTTSLLVGTDGKRKMSQSYGNTINIADSPNEQFGKVMRLPDESIIHYFELATLITNQELEKIRKAIAIGEFGSREAKMRLGREIVTLYHGAGAAQAAEREFVNVFQKKQAPSDILEIKLPHNHYRLDDLLLATKAAASRSDAQRKISSASVTLDGQTLIDWKTEIKLGSDLKLVQVGKRFFIQVRQG
jgi:tyrosyl-tRNA synthetase